MCFVCSLDGPVRTGGTGLGVGEWGAMSLGGNGEPSTREVGTKIRSYMLTAPCEHHFLSETWNSGDQAPDLVSNRPPATLWVALEGGPWNRPARSGSRPEGRACCVDSGRSGPWDPWRNSHPTSLSPSAVGGWPAAWVQIELCHLLTRLFMGLPCA